MFDIVADRFTVEFVGSPGLSHADTKLYLVPLHEMPEVDKRLVLSDIMVQSSISNRRFSNKM